MRPSTRCERACSRASPRSGEHNPEKWALPRRRAKLGSGAATREIVFGKDQAPQTKLQSGGMRSGLNASASPPLFLLLVQPGGEGGGARRRLPLLPGCRPLGWRVLLGFLLGGLARKPQGAQPRRVGVDRRGLRQIVGHGLLGVGSLLLLLDLVG